MLATICVGLTVPTVQYQKSNIVKSLEQLAEQELIVAKSYGKMSIYTVKQNTQDMLSPEEIEAMDKEYESFSQDLGKLKTENTALSRSLTELKNTPTTIEARSLLNSVMEQNIRNEERLAKLQSGTVLVSEADQKRINEEYEINRKEWRKRRKLFTEIFNTVTEHLPGNPMEFREQLGIEEDTVAYDHDPLTS
ncbi:PSMC3 interacting protein [Apophysomyces ossiformis]|uniref:Homologous-pairing protein 2 homolog n=1 Tax=Apophysomyces ossiformis TaxID=679940 RepID=A0A8H7ES91_9FUNG|nr:PSMC3 interacting protein [Apophysomyces ossiformis]